MVVVTLISLVTGCKSTSGGGGAFAAVTISSPSQELVRETVLKVFAEEGFYDASRGRSWFLDRPTSKMGRLLHGGWFDESGVRERAKLRLIGLSEGVYRLECTGVMVRDAGDPFFEEEAGMTGLKSNPYKKRLAEVEKRVAAHLAANP